MKKSLSILLAGTLLLGTLSACQSNPNQTENTSGATTDMNDPTIPIGGTPATEIDLTAAEEIEYYQNPILTAKTKDAWQNYGFGDPFVMRFNGVYYLYVSTKDGNPGIKCWSSTDLIHWTYEKSCTNEKISTGAYAPEVYYYNGSFYMYTSPAGNGHYVLKSDSPTGPFTVITDNMGMSIDGSVFIDNNGKWYFYTAGGGNIQYYNMTSPSRMTGGASLANVSVNGGWTEGPMVVYHDGYYYMTYTGNHVLSEAYRIYYAASNKSPINFPSGADNPLLVNTSSEMVGIGHSSTVKGPDLDSYYIVYHSLESQNGPNRNMNIDRIVFNDTDMEIMGPTTAKQQVPDMPDIYAYFNAGDSMDGWTLSGSFGTTGSGLPLSAGSTFVSNYRFTGNYTAEYNVTSIANGGMAGAIFSYTDPQNFGACLFDPASQKVIITITVNGQSTVKETDMVQSFKEKVKFDCVQSLQIEKDGNDYTFYMNDHLLCKIKDSDLPGGAIGYIAQNADASFGFIGGTGAVGGQGASDEYKIASALSGLIPANTYTTGTFPTEKKGSVNAVVAQEGNVLNYRVLASLDAYYDLTAHYYTGDSNSPAVIEIYIDGALAAEHTLGGSKSFATAVVRALPLTKGQHTVSIKLKSGNASFDEFTLMKNETVKAKTIDFAKNVDGNQYSDGTWKIQGGKLVMTGNPATGKRLYGDKNWGDYVVTVEVTPGADVNCGLLVRATNPGACTFQLSQGTDADAQTSTDWVEGYYVGLTGSNVLLGKQSYGYDALKSAKGSFKTGTTYTLKVVCQGANIQIYVDDQLYIDYTDADAFTQGMVGVRTHKCAASFDNLTVAPIE
ncbi:MAG: family 43 glycosylhydrolase [Eubacteriales bacterium]